MSRSNDRGFTLYEVLIATVILALGVLGAVALFPKALETQQVARQKIFAAAIATDLTASFSEGGQQNWFSGYEDTTLTKTMHGPDLERIGSGSIGASTDPNRAQDINMAVPFEPVPWDVLRRLDSDHDEIRRLVEEGAAVFYPRPYRIETVIDGMTQTLENGGEALNSMVFAVVGYAQENAEYHVPSHFHAAYQDGGTNSVPGNYRFHEQAQYCRRPVNIGGRLFYRHNYWRFNSHGGNAIAMPRHGYFWEHEVQVNDGYAPWPTPNQAAPSMPPGMPAFDGDRDTCLPERTQETNSLFVPFKPVHRCRQLVFWSVDWKDYEDAEVVPSSPVDIARFPVSSGVSSTIDGTGSPAVLETGWASPSTYENNLRLGAGWDRNFNGKLDVGRVPRSVRLRARTIARFNYYDKRLVAMF